MHICVDPMTAPVHSDRYPIYICIYECMYICVMHIHICVYMRAYAYTYTCVSARYQLSTMNFWCVYFRV